MDEKVTYHQQASYCGKARCRKCREGDGHGPYWCAYRIVNGRTVRTYIGKELPPEIRATLDQRLRTPLPETSASLAEQALIRLYTLGQFRLERRIDHEWQTITDPSWHLHRVRMLLASLISSPNRTVGREQVIEMLWPERNLEVASRHLDRAVYSLRQLFEPTRDRPATSPLLRIEYETVMLAGQNKIWIDADAFEQRLSQARQSDESGEKLRLLEEVATLYGGDFLPEERTIASARMRRAFLQRSWIGLLIELADLHAAQNPHRAIAPLDRVLQADPTNEAAAQRLMLLLAQLNRRGEALRVYKQLAALLQQDYHIVPLPETRSLYETLRQGTVERMRVDSVHGTTHADIDAGQNATHATSPAMQIGRSHQGPLVGRERELATLQNVLTATEQATRFKLPGQKRGVPLPLDTQRSAQATLLVGDVGIGKTRLAEEVARRTQKRGWGIAWSRVYPQELSMPYRPWIEVLRKAMEQGPWQREELSKRPIMYHPLTTLLPELNRLLPSVVVPPSQSAEQEQLHLWEAARALLSLISESTPLLIVLDDLQWADRSSSELFAYLARHTYGLPIVMLGTCRENELTTYQHLHRLLADLQREHAVETVTLPPLSDEQIGTIVSHLPHLPQPIVQSIQSRAAGNPFFAEELARTMKQMAQEQPPSPLSPSLPESIAAVLNIRLSRLSASCQLLLSKAAVLGGSFEFRHISAMEASTPTYTEEAVLDLIEEALQAGMLTEEGSGTRITYQFWHPLLVTHLYERLSAAHRASFHRRAAEMLRQEFEGHKEEGAAPITYHLVRSGAPAIQIVSSAELAGHHAYTLSAYPDAEYYYRLATHALQRVLQPQAKADPDEQCHLAYMQEVLGECLNLQGKMEEARSWFEQALRTRQASLVPPPTPTQPLAEEETQLQAMLLCEIGTTWFVTGESAKARTYYRQGERMLREGKVSAGPAWAHLLLQECYIDWREGKYEQAQSMALEGLKLLQASFRQQVPATDLLRRQTLIRRSLLGDPVELGRIHVILGNLANVMGQPSQAIVHWNEAQTIFEHYASQRELAIIACNLSDVHMRRAEYRAAQATLHQSLHLGQRVGDGGLQAVCYGNLGVLAYRMGNLAEAERCYRQAIALAEQLQDPANVSIFSAYLGQTLQGMGKVQEARAALARSLSLSRTLGVPPCIGLALVTIGEMHMMQALAPMTAGEQEEPTHRQASRYALSLQRAHRALQRALAIKNMETDTTLEGHLALAECELLLGRGESIEQRIRQVLSEIEHVESFWLLGRAQRLLGRLLFARSCSPSLQSSRELQAEALHTFEEALRTLHQQGMRLEYARTLQAWYQAKGTQHTTILYRALDLFTACHATLEEQILRCLLPEPARRHTTALHERGAIPKFPS